MNTIFSMKLTSSYKRLIPFMHIIGWCIILGVPFFFTGQEKVYLDFKSYIRAILVPLSMMFVFYVNFFVLIDRFLFKKHVLHFLLANAVLVVIAMGTVHFLMPVLSPPPPDEHHPPLTMVIRFIIVNILLYYQVAGLSVAIKMTAGWFKVESDRRDLEKSRAEAELQNLKSQLNPHFLFNTLNNIYSLIAVNPDDAQESVHELSNLLRYVLYESSQPLVPLEKEFNFIRNYVELMRIRLPQHVELHFSIDETTPGTQIAPLLFISLIENAFKHGVSNNKVSFIDIDIRQENKRIICLICNSYFPKDLQQDKSGSGIGLQNLHRRLDLIYPGRYIFTHELKGDEFVSLLEIQT